MKVRLDLHTHSRFSADGISVPEGMVAAARQAGLDGLAITDHDTSAAVDYFIRAGLMRADGEPVDGFLIIPGQEVTTAQGHLLALGVVLPPMKGISAAEAVGEIHRRGGLAVPAHPFDGFRAGMGAATMDRLPVDAIEVFNAACTFSHQNRRALRYASHRGLPGLAGSDAHHEEAIGVSCTAFEVASLNVGNVLEAVLAGGVRTERRQGLRDFIKKTFHNAFRSSYPGREPAATPDDPS